MLQWFAARIGAAQSSLHYTAAFGIAQPIAEALSKGHMNPDGGLRRSSRISRRSTDKYSSDSPVLRYILLESKPSQKSSEKKRQAASKNGKHYLDYYDLTKINENRIAYGAILNSTYGDEDDVIRESLSGLNKFVDYVHTKVSFQTSNLPYLLQGMLSLTPFSIC